jgi:hypothetical protein
MRRSGRKRVTWAKALSVAFSEADLCFEIHRLLVRNNSLLHRQQPPVEPNHRHGLRSETRHPNFVPPQSQRDTRLDTLRRMPTTQRTRSPTNMSTPRGGRGTRGVTAPFRGAAGRGRGAGVPAPSNAERPSLGVFTPRGRGSTRGGTAARAGNSTRGAPNARGNTRGRGNHA